MEKENDRILLPKVIGYRCFGCGTANPRGLNMNFYALGSRVCSDIVLDDYHMGWENIAHGGIISTILDETMAWAVVAFKRVFFVTKSMEVRYLRPVHVNVPLTAMAEINPEPLRRGCRVKAVLLDTDGIKLAEAFADMAFLSEKRLPQLPEDYKCAMENIFLQMHGLLGPIES